MVARKICTLGDLLKFIEGASLAELKAKQLVYLDAIASSVNNKLYNFAIRGVCELHMIITKISELEKSEGIHG